MAFRERTIGALILAGGKSTRMNTPKALLTVKGETFIAHVAECLTEQPEKIISVGQNGFSMTGWQSVVDVQPNCGPLGGIYSALLCCKSEALLVLPCDLPCVTADFTKYLCSFSRSGWNAWVIRTRDKRLHPLCGVYSKKCLPIIEQMMSEENYRMRDLLERTDARVLELQNTPFPDGILCNVNTPQEYKAIR